MSALPRRVLRSAAVSFVLCGAMVGWPGDVSAAPPTASAPGVNPCISHTEEKVPAAHRFNDTPPVTQADLDAVQELPARPRNARSMVPYLASPVRIPVYVHVIKGRHKGERVPAGPRKVKRMIRILNHGFAGHQWPKAHRSRYSFVLKHIDYTRNDGWYHAYLFGPRDKRMRQTLHRGGRRTLNIYINGGGPTGMPVLGWSRFPWQYAGAPRLDGITVNWKALPGGTLHNYRSGDTVIHETGHWMGLFHTFQNGCRAPGDRVPDTHPEGTPSYYCDEHADSCPDKAGKDPVHNFMDYSWDRCMNHFTDGQLARMDRVFSEYRL